VIVPYKDRTFDADREVTPVEELLDQHSGRLTLQDYAYPHPSRALHMASNTEKGCLNSRLNHTCLRQQERPSGWMRFESDDHHHWCVWRTADFLALCAHIGLTVIEHQDPDDKVGNGFTVVMVNA